MITALTPEQESLREHFRVSVGYPAVALLDSGEWACVSPFYFTAGLLVGLDQYGYRTRFCYARIDHALLALMTWDGRGDPPGHWLKEKSRRGDRLNPHLCNCEFNASCCALHPRHV